MTGSFVTDEDIYEFTVEKSIGSDRYIIWYIKSGQPQMYVVPGRYTYNQIIDFNFVADKIMIFDKQ